MALPQDITQINYDVANTGQNRVFRSSNGDHYVLVHDSALNKLEVLKSDDGLATFSPMDPGNAPAQAHQPSSNVTLDTIHVLYHDMTAATVGTWYYAQFSMLTDSWALVDTVVVSGISAELPTGIYVKGAVQPHGVNDVIAVFSGDSDKIMGTDYARVQFMRWDNIIQAWTGPYALDQAGSANYALPNVVYGDTSAHAIYKNYDTDQLYHREIFNDNTLGAVNTLGTSSSATTQARLDVHDDNGDEVVTVVLRNADLEKYTITNSGAPSGPVTFSDGTTAANSRFTVVADEDTDEVYAVHILGAGGGDIQLSDSTATYPVIYAGSANLVTHGNILIKDNGDKVIAYVFEEGSQVYYNEYVLSASGPTTTDMTPAVSSVSAVTASVTQIMSVSAAVVSASIITATLSQQTTTDITPAVNGLSTVTAALSQIVITDMTSAISANTVITATLDQTTDLTASVNALSAVSAAPQALISISPIVNSTTIVAAPLQQLVSLSSTISTQSSVSAAPERVIDLTAAVSSAALISTSLQSVTLLNNAVNVPSTISSTLTQIVYISPSVSAQSAVSASLGETLSTSINSAISALSVVSAPLTTVKHITSAVAAQSAVSAAVDQVVLLQTSVAGAGALTTNLQQLQALTVTVSAVSAVSTILGETGFTNLTASVNAASALSTTVTQETFTNLTSVITGSAVVTVDPQQITHVQPSITGASVVTAQLGNLVYANLTPSVVATGITITGLQSVTDVQNTVQATSTVTVAPSQLVLLTPAIASLGQVASTLSTITHLAPVVVGASTVTANIIYQLESVFVFEPTATITPALGITASDFSMPIRVVEQLDRPLHVSMEIIMFYENSTASFTVSFTDENGTPTDPTGAITLYVRKVGEDTPIITHAYGDAPTSDVDITKEAIGVYKAVFTVSQYGRYKVGMQGNSVGSPAVQGYVETNLDVKRREAVVG